MKTRSKGLMVVMLFLAVSLIPAMVKAVATNSYKGAQNSGWQNASSWTLGHTPLVSEVLSFTNYAGRGAITTGGMVNDWTVDGLLFLDPLVCTSAIAPSASTTNYWRTLTLNATNTPYAIYVKTGNTAQFGNNVRGSVTNKLGAATDFRMKAEQDAVLEYTILSDLEGDAGKNITFEGPGTLAFNRNNTFGGAGTTLTLTNCILNLKAAAAATGMGDVGNTVVIKQGVILKNSHTAAITIGNYVQRWCGDFSSQGTSLNLGLGTVALDDNIAITVASNTLTVGGSITGAYGIVKSGSGKLSLSGECTYTGSTVVSNGTLSLTSSGSVSSSAVINVTSGGTCDVSAVAGFAIISNQTLSGEGVVTGSVVIVSGGTLAPGGLGTAGTLTCKSAVTNNGIFLVDLLKDGACDTLDVPGKNLNIDNAVFQVADFSKMKGGTNYTVATYGTLSGTFGATNAPLGTKIMFTNNTIQVSRPSIDGFVITIE